MGKVNFEGSYFISLTSMSICGTLQYSTVQYSTVQYSTVQYSTVQSSTIGVDLLTSAFGTLTFVRGVAALIGNLYCTVMCCTVLYCTVLCCIVLYCVVLYCIVLHCTAQYCTVPYCRVTVSEPQTRVGHAPPSAPSLSNINYSVIFLS